MKQTSKHDLESNDDKPSGWWQSRTLLEKVSIPAIVILSLTSSILLTVIIMTSSTASKNEPQVCSTPGCVQAANYLLNAINTSVDPCTDFFEFSCGLWIEQHPIPDDKSSITNMGLVEGTLSQQLRALLEQNVTSESKAMNMARITYQSCMNTVQIEELKSRPLFETIKSLGKWPILETNWTKSSFKLTDLLAHSTRDNGVDVYFQFSIGADFKNNSRHMLFIDQGQVSIGSEVYFLDHVKYSKQITAYRKYFQKIVQLLKTDGKLAKSDDEINRDVDKIIAFETEIAKLVVPAEKRKDISRLLNERKMQDLYELMPQLDWIDYFRRIVPSNLTYLFNNETAIIISELEYLKKLSKLLESTDSGVVANYAVWRVVQSKVSYLDERFDGVAQDFVNIIYGQKKRAPKWSQCTAVPMAYLPQAVGAMYVQTHFQENDKYEAIDMVLDLKSSFLEMLEQNDWMDEETKAEAIKKINFMNNYVGYHDEIKDLKKLDDKFKGLDIKDGDGHYKVIEKLGSYYRTKGAYKLTKPPSKDGYSLPPAVVNAFYSPIDNFIAFPAGILQPPLFSGMFPKAVNYGSMGSVIGHEITHGFDDQGSQFDEHGKVRNWWSNRSLDAFKKKTGCIVDQYGSYTVPGTTYKVNGVKTQSENIGDNGGLKIAFRAYQKYVKKHGEEPRLAGLRNYTNEQLFFISYAYFHCGKQKDEATMRKIVSDEHAPLVFRVNGAVSNMKEFADVFKCPRNSPVNPDHKCVVW